MPGAENPGGTRLAEAGQRDDSHAAPSPAESGGDQEGAPWRDELSARLSSYRARRKPHPPRYPSLRLPFEDSSRSGGPGSSQTSPSSAFDAMSDRALALDVRETTPGLPGAEASVPSPRPPSGCQSSPHAGAKIIEFPRSIEEAAQFSWDELAEPVCDRPRILEAPEVAPAPPALGGITMEAAAGEEVERRPGIDIPLQSASFTRRLVASVIDGFIVAAASAFFGFIFWKVAAVQPPRFQSLALALGVPILMWATYQYLLIVYSGSTPGLRLAGLQIKRFDGSFTNRRLRRFRVLASYLSAVSLGMGYAWVFLDEDSLCWHDRITHSYVGPARVGQKH
jgi:uncharacterized RDD family membrane protein YckC